MAHLLDDWRDTTTIKCIHSTLSSLVRASVSFTVCGGGQSHRKRFGLRDTDTIYLLLSPLGVGSRALVGPRVAPLRLASAEAFLLGLPTLISRYSRSG